MNILKLFNARQAIERIYAYRYFPATVSFYLRGIRHEVLQPIIDYVDTRNGLLDRYGVLQEDGTYQFNGEDAMRFKAECALLDEQEVGFEIDPERFFLDLEKLDEMERDIPVHLRLGLSAEDMNSLEGIIVIR